MRWEALGIEATTAYSEQSLSSGMAVSAADLAHASEYVYRQGGVRKDQVCKHVSMCDTSARSFKPALQPAQYVKMMHGLAHRTSCCAVFQLRLNLLGQPWRA